MLRYHSRDQNAYATNDHFPPISRTMRYKKVTKPLLERKRRARMNKCLDELKDLVCAMEADGENINKLEKADILELTVRHLKRISRLHDPVQEAHRFQAGFSQCANEVCTFLVSLPGLNSALGSRLLEHLKQCISKHRTPYPMVPSAADHPVHVNSPKPLQVSVVSSQRFSPPLSPSPASSIESPVRPMMSSQKPFLPYKDVIHSSSPSPPAHPEDLSTQESNSMWRPW